MTWRIVRSLIRWPLLKDSALVIGRLLIPICSFVAAIRRSMTATSGRLTPEGQSRSWSSVDNNRPMHSSKSRLPLLGGAYGLAAASRLVLQKKLQSIQGFPSPRCRVAPAICGSTLRSTFVRQHDNHLHSGDDSRGVRDLCLRGLPIRGLLFSPSFPSPALLLHRGNAYALLPDGLVRSRKRDAHNYLEVAFFMSTD